jgi:hypothetical protein
VAFYDSLAKAWNVDAQCVECGTLYPVMVSEPEEASGWICNDCDRKHNPEDYEDE